MTASLQSAQTGVIGAGLPTPGLGRIVGVTLGLAYAQRYPERVTEMVLLSCTMTRPSDVHWLYHEAGRFFPEEWHRYQEGGGNADDLVAAYDKLLNADPDPAVRARAARDWCDWEDAVNSLEEGWAPSQRYADPRFRMTFARLCTHYFSHAAWLGDGQLLRDAHWLADIPGMLIHGRFDLQTAGRALAPPPGLAGLRTAPGPDRLVSRLDCRPATELPGDYPDRTCTGW